MDFFNIVSREIEKGPNKGNLEVFPDFRVGRSKDLMIRGRAFYAIWDEENSLWSTDEYAVQRIVDSEMEKEADRLESETGLRPKVKSMASFGSSSWKQFKMFLQNISDSNRPLDEKLTFSDTEVKKSDYASKRLSYPLVDGDYSAWDELIGTLYNVEERAKLEWAIGAVVSGDARKIQKFLVLYGAAGTGKSTMLGIMEKMFSGYLTTFDAQALGSSSAAFATEVFKENPLVAIQHDGDLSKIEDNTKLNSIISHENMPMNEKYKPGYTARVNAFLFMGTNKPVKISDAKSGIIRRLIDVHPTGVTLSPNHYNALMSQVDFELGAIAKHCLDVYLSMGSNFYNAYRPLEMMYQTDIFFNFIESNFDLFKEQNGVTIRQAYVLYKEFCADTGIEKPLPQIKVRTELRNYFDEYKERGELNGHVVRSLYSGFNANKFKAPVKDGAIYSLVLEETESIFDEMMADSLAQLGTSMDTPRKAWNVVETKLRDIDTTQLHFVQVPENHIIIDFDLKDDDGGKSLERNLAAASSWPPTYGELSKSGGGVHLHYIYDGDISELNPDYSEGIEVKVYRGGAALRRRLSRCNAVPVATINSGIPLKEKKPVVNSEKTMKSEKGLRDLVGRNIQKEIHQGTKPSMDFILKIMEEAKATGMTYDLSDMRSSVMAFANNSSNRAMECLKIYKRIPWKSEDAGEDAYRSEQSYGDDPVYSQDAPSKPSLFSKEDLEKIAFYDVEVYPNLFIICWKFAGKDASVVRMINPSPQEVEALFALKLVGFYNRRYDNHIIYARYMGYTIPELFELSNKMVNGNPGRGGNVPTFGEAYGLSYTDIWDFSSKKQSLKKFQIELGLKHVELDIPWDKPVPDELIEKITDYCANDVETTEETFNSRKQDFIARQILAELSGLTVNDPTNKHTAKIIFGNNRTPQDQFIYTDLATGDEFTQPHVPNWMEKK